jgi:hypothetical protein
MSLVFLLERERFAKTSVTEATGRLVRSRQPDVLDANQIDFRLPEQQSAHNVAVEVFVGQ